MEYPGREDGEFDNLRAVVALVWRYKIWLIATISLVSLIFTAAAFLQRPVYRATVVFTSSGDDRLGIGSGLGVAGSIGGLAQLAGLSLGSSGDSTEEALAVLQSRRLTEEFLVENSLLQVLYESKWDSEKGGWIVPERKRPTSAMGFKYFDTKIRTVSHDRRTGLVRLTIDWTDGVVAADWANALIKKVNSEMRSRAIRDSEAAIRHLELELSSTTALETRQAISRLLESQINKRMLATVIEDYAFRVIESAMAPDSRDIIRPRRALMLIAGPIAGLVLGIGMIMLFNALAPRSNAKRA